MLKWMKCDPVTKHLPGGSVPSYFGSVLHDYEVQVCSIWWRLHMHSASSIWIHNIRVYKEQEILLHLHWRGQLPRVDGRASTGVRRDFGCTIEELNG